MYKDIIKQNFRNGSEDIMNKSIDMVSDLLEDVKKASPDMYWVFLRKQFGLMSKGHYDETWARYDVSQLWHKNVAGEKIYGEHWSIDDIRKVRSQRSLPSDVTEWDVYVALNAFWHDMTKKIAEDNLIIEAAIAFWFCDDDFTGNNKIWWYMCNKMNM